MFLTRIPPQYSSQEVGHWCIRCFVLRTEIKTWLVIHEGWWPHAESRFVLVP